MQSLRSNLRTAAAATLVLASVCCGFYPLLVFGIGQLLFHHQVNGSLITDRQGVVRGSRLLGQGFVAAKFFHPRPSAAGQGYDAANSGGSNLGPTSQRLHDLIQERVSAYRLDNGLPDGAPVPVDAVTASGSGLDPHISLSNAELQLPRVARARGVPENQLRTLIRSCVEGPQLGLLGEPGVNVLRLNLALEDL